MQSIKIDFLAAAFYCTSDSALGFAVAVDVLVAAMDVFAVHKSLLLF
jgi:hypothetical protein